MICYFDQSTTDLVEIVQSFVQVSQHACGRLIGDLDGRFQNSLQKQSWWRDGEGKVDCKWSVFEEMCMKFDGNKSISKKLGALSWDFYSLMHEPRKSFPCQIQNNSSSNWFDGSVFPLHSGLLWHLQTCTWGMMWDSGVGAGSADMKTR